MELSNVVDAMGKFFDRDNLLNAIHLERRRSAMERVVMGAGLFATGLLVGAVSGVIYSQLAPEGFRKSVSRGISSVRQRASRLAESNGESRKGAAQSGSSQHTPERTSRQSVAHS